MRVIYDIEADSLNPTKIWCMAYFIIGVHKSIEDVQITTNYVEMRDILTRATELVGHNIQCFDNPALERLLNIKISASIIDTLWLSYYLYPRRNRHNLDSFGKDLGVDKPPIDDWENLSIEEYCNRCVEDVKINTLLWGKMQNDLKELYKDKPESLEKLVKYISFKGELIAEQEKCKLKLDIPYLKGRLEELDSIYNTAYEELLKKMPPIPIYVQRKRPVQQYKKDGSFTKGYEAWLELCNEMGEPEDTTSIKTITGYEAPKPNSHNQLKNWLFSMGWEPITFEYRKNNAGDTNKIPQISTKDKEICKSVQNLYEVEPALRNLEGFTVAKHRADVLRGFLSNCDEEGYIQASAVGLTNTLRYKHKNIVNLPGAGKQYGEWVRSCIVAPDPLIFCGADVSALETMTKLHYIRPYDPHYVEKLLREDYDPHLDLALSAGYLTEEQVQAHKDKTEDHSKIRHVFKQANYSCVYGASAYTLSIQSNIPLDNATKIVDTYRKLNWAVDYFAERLETKEWGGGSWLYNPVSKMYYSLRHNKDRFSTVNQSTGVYIFDLWVYFARQGGVKILMNMHDEILIYCREENKDKLAEFLEKCMDKVNQTLQLNVEIKVTPQFGRTYWDVH